MALPPVFEAAFDLGQVDSAGVVLSSGIFEQFDFAIFLFRAHPKSLVLASIVFEEELIQTAI